MTQFTDIITQTFKVVTCYTCGIPFGITSELYKRAVTDAIGSVTCPACGKLTCWRESDDQKKIKELERKLTWETNEVARQKQQREVAEASLTATRGVVTKMRKRVSVGTCPCCKRNFSQLARHMKTKHPDFGIVEHPID
jgi:hypothetical protein